MGDNRLDSATKSFKDNPVLKSVHPKYRQKLIDLWEKVKPGGDFVPPERPEGQSDREYADLVENFISSYNENAETRPEARSVWDTSQSSSTNLDRPTDDQGVIQSRRTSSSDPKPGVRSFWDEAPQERKDYDLDPAQQNDWTTADIDRVYQELVDAGEIEADSMAVTTQKKKQILRILGGRR